MQHLHRCTADAPAPGPYKSSLVGPTNDQYIHSGLQHVSGGGIPVKQPAGAGHGVGRLGPRSGRICLSRGLKDRHGVGFDAANQSGR